MRSCSSVAEHRSLASRIGAADPPRTRPGNGMDTARKFEQAHVVAERAQLGLERRRRSPLLQLDEAEVAAADIRQIDRLLRIEMSVEDADECLGVNGDWNPRDSGGTRKSGMINAQAQTLAFLLQAVLRPFNHLCLTA